MRNNITCFTVRDIQDSQLFFEMINNCFDPVMILVGHGQTQDLRRNIIAQNYLTWMDPYSRILEVELMCTSCQDIEMIMKFMDKNHLEKMEKF